MFIKYKTLKFLSIKYFTISTCELFVPATTGFIKLLNLAIRYLMKEARILLAVGVKQLHHTARVAHAKRRH